MKVDRTKTTNNKINLKDFHLLKQLINQLNLNTKFNLNITKNSYLIIERNPIVNSILQ